MPAKWCNTYAEAIGILRAESGRDQYHLRLGQLVGNLQSLEFALRAVLYNANLPPEGGPELSIQLHQLEQGQVVPVNAMTDYRSLNQLITDYNKLVDRSLRVDTRVVALRDALAHGRLAMPEPAADMIILKFSPEKEVGPEKKRQVIVKYAETMTEAWFRKSIRLVLQEVTKVTKAGQFLIADPENRPVLD
jgi:hypothetical protein